MPLLDALAVAAVAQELTERVGARVQDVLQGDRRSVALELYSGERWYLTLSADPVAEGVAYGPDRARRGTGAPTPLTLSLRTRLEGARLLAVRATPFDRVLSLDFQAEEGLRLVAELTGRLANLVLLDADERVLAASHAVTPAMSRARVVLPGRTYAPPPPPPKLPPQRVGVAQLAQWLAAAPEEPAWRTLMGQVLAVAPLAGRELVHRAGADVEAPGRAVDPARLAEAMSAFFAAAAAGSWSPSVVVAAEGRVVAYAAYRLTHRAGVEAVATIGEAIARYGARRSGSDPYHLARAEVAGLVAAALARAARKEAALARQQADPAQIEALREAGELILAFGHGLRPGASELVAGFDPAAPRTIALDPALSASENAQRYFDRYRRKRRAAAALPERAAEAAARRATLEQLALDLDLASDRAAIDAVQDELAALGLTPRPPRPKAAPPTGPLTWISSDGFTVLVGRNSRQNERVTFERAARGDLWLHAHGVPGAHVVVKSAGRPVPERTVLEAAALAAWYSRARDSASAPVMVTDVRYVRRLKGGGRGMVTVDRAETVVVRPEEVNRRGAEDAEGSL